MFTRRDLLIDALRHLASRSLYFEEGDAFTINLPAIPLVGNLETNVAVITSGDTKCQLGFSQMIGNLWNTTMWEPTAAAVRGAQLPRFGDGRVKTKKLPSRL